MGSVQPLQGRDRAKQVSRTGKEQIYPGQAGPGSQHVICLQGSGQNLCPGLVWIEMGCQCCLSTLKYEHENPVPMEGRVEYLYQECRGRRIWSSEPLCDLQQV